MIHNQTTLIPTTLPPDPPMSYFPLTKTPFSQPLPHLTINPPLEGELDHPSGGCIYVPFLLLLSDTLDSRPYTGIDYGFNLVYGNHRKIHSPSHELTLDSWPFMGIDFVSPLKCESTLDSLPLTWINSIFPSIYVNITLIDLYWIPVPIRELTLDSRPYLESS